MKYKYIIFSMIVLIACLGFAFASPNDPAEFGNLTTTTCWVGGSAGIVNCTGNTNIGGSVTATNFYGIFNGNSSIWSRAGTFIFPTNIGDYVGIGTANPGRELEIYSSSSQVRIRDSGATANATTAFVEFGGTDAAAWSRTGFVGDSASANANIKLAAEVADLLLDAADDIILTPGGTGVGIGTTTIPHGGEGYAKFAIEGTVSNAAGPHVQFTASADDYPLVQMLHWSHDNIQYMFDAYYDGSYKSSDAGSNLNIQKNSDLLRFKYDSGIAQGGVITWNDGLVMDLTNGNVGIGVLDPDAKLEVATGTTSGDNLVLSTTDTIAPHAKVKLRLDALTNDPFAEMQFYAPTEDASEYFRINIKNTAGVTTEALTIDRVGKVGIGIAAPTEKLQVSGNIFMTTDSNKMLFGTAKDASIYYDGADLYIDTQEVGAGDLIIPNGNVGIGTTSPSELLEIEGTNTTIRIEDTTYTNTVGLHLRAGSKDARITHTYGLLKLAGDAGDNVNIELSASDTTNQLWLDVDGNVGIGTSSPSATLDVVGNIEFLNPNDGLMYGDNLNWFSLSASSGYPFLSWFAYNNGSDFISSHSTQRSAQIWSNQALIFMTAPGQTASGSIITDLTERMRIEDNGNVGIGTVSPATLLDVAGTITTQSIRPLEYYTLNNIRYYKLGNLAAVGSRVHIKIIGQNSFADPTTDITYATVSIGNVDNEFAAWQYTIGDSTAKPTVIWKDPGGTNNIDVYVKIGIYFSGSVEIIEGRGFTIDSDPTGAVGDPSGTDATDVMSIQSNTHIRAYNFSVDTNVLFVDSNNDRVGIGTSSPGALLEVEGSDDTNPLMIIENTHASGRGLHIIAGNTGGTGTQELLRVYAGGTDRFIINEAGNVGIGTVAPSEKLEVNGSITITSNNGLLKATQYKIFVQPGTGEASATETSDTYYSINRFENAALKYWRLNVQAPTGATGISSVKVYYAGASAGNLILRFRFSRWDTDTPGVAKQDDATDALSAYAGQAAGTGIITVPAAAYDGLTFDEGDALGLSIIRDGSGGSDTYEEDWDVFGVEFIFS